MAREKGYLPTEPTGLVRKQCWWGFSTDSITLAADDTYEAVTIPAYADEVVLKSTGNFTVGESATATGFETDEIQLGISGMETLYLKGSSGQTIQILWGLTKGS